MRRKRSSDDTDVKHLACTFLGEEAGPLRAYLCLVLQKNLFAPGLVPPGVHPQGKVECCQHLYVFGGPGLDILHVMKHEGLGYVHLAPRQLLVWEGKFGGPSHVDWVKGDCIFHW